MATPRKPKELHLPDGAPTLYRPDFHPQDFIRLSKQGKNLTQISLEWDLCRDTLYEWSKVHPKFSYAVKKGREFAEAWYTNLGQLAMIGQASVNGVKTKVDVGMFVWMTKNLFKWSDKMEETSKVSGSISVVNIKQVKAVLEKIEKDF